MVVIYSFKKMLIFLSFSVFYFLRTSNYSDQSWLYIVGVHMTHIDIVGGFFNPVIIEKLEKTKLPISGTGIVEFGLYYMQH